MKIAALLGMIFLTVSPLIAQTPASQPSAGFEKLDEMMGAHGTMADEVYTYRLPRTDLIVSVEGMEVPAAAGIESIIHLFHCHCGKLRVVGEFCCADYEANDVIDALRTGGLIEIAGVCPMLVGDKPHLTIVRFDGEGGDDALVQPIINATKMMGVNRGKKQPPQ